MEENKAKRKTQEKITDTLKENYMPYAMSVIVSRAIPQIDGFKPSHRKLLYTMYKMGLLSGNRTKSANIVGQTMKLNPHGEGAIYETMVRMTRSNESLLHPFIDSKGNFGKVHSRDMKYAASRYTEAKLADLCKEVFKDIDKETVEFMDNYDSTMKEPVLLPVTFPNVLISANRGIAVGMASAMPGFNLTEVCNYAIAYIRNKKAEITDYILGPDLPTGGELIYEESVLKEIYASGRGTFKLRGKYVYDKANGVIEIFEIPYTTTVEAIIEKIIDLMKSGRLKEVTDVRDETDLNGLKITLDVRKNINAELLMAKIYRYTALEDSFGCNFNILIDHRPMVLGVSAIVGYWLDFRRQCLLGQASFDTQRKSEKLNLLQGLQKILLDIDEAIAIIRGTQKEAEVIPNLMKHFNIDEAQAQFIAEIKLRNLNEEYILKRVEETSRLTKEIADLRALMESEKLQNQQIIKELKNVIGLYGQPRKTSIIYPENIVEHQEENAVAEYSVNIFATQEGYIKKITDSSLRGNSEQKIKENDRIIFTMKTSNSHTLYIFGDQGSMYQLRLSDLPETKASLLGEYLPGILQMDENEKVLKIIHPFDHSGYMIFLFENAKMAKIPLASYETKGYRRKLQNAYNTKSKLILAHFQKEESYIYVETGKERWTVVDTALLSSIASRSSQGVNALRLLKNENINTAFEISYKEMELSSLHSATKLPATFRKKEKEKQISFDIHEK